MQYKHKKLIWQIFPANLVITLTAMLAVAWYGSSALQNFYYQQMTSALEARAYLIQDRINELFSAGKIDNLRSFIRKSGRDGRTRITIVDLQGKVVADSNEVPNVMEPHGTRPEIVSAYGGTIGHSLRFSTTLQENMLYVAVPLLENGHIPGKVTGVLRVAIPLTAIKKTLRDVRARIALGAVAVVFLAAVMTLLVSRRISKPLEEIKQSAARFAQGDFHQGMSLKKSESASLEVAALAESMDRMAAQLDERIRTISRQHNELETVFTSMAEGVLAVDNDERIIRMNQAAAKIFDVDQRDAQGKLIQEMIRNVDLQRQVKEILVGLDPLQGEIVSQEGQQERYLQTNGVSLYDGSGNNIGVLVVLNDVTRLRRLENVRRDFVANVSHELKTPITSIKGYVETLLDGAIDNKEEAVSFLKIVLKQSDLLYAIIEDLLALSRIEEQSDECEVELKRETLHPVLEESVLTCKMKAKQKNITISLFCPDTIQAGINATLLEQALVNLVVNAIKYSDEGSEVIIRAEEKQLKDGADRIVISVQDFGVGIAKKHLPRLFERFYRSDKARSRKLGGTGLGLAIVKHIVQAHGGEVSVESREGEGSIFYISLPVLS
ncbi:MAG: ATP-binding protein [Pseudomonadota bacterium]